MKKALIAAVLAVVTYAPAYALSVQGTLDPVTGFQNLLPYLLGLCGLAIVGVCAIRGVQASYEGRHLGPYIGGAVGGIGLCFGGAYLLTHYGVV